MLLFVMLLCMTRYSYIDSSKERRIGMFIPSDVGRRFGILNAISAGNSGEKTLGSGEQDEVNP